MNRQRDDKKEFYSAMKRILFCGTLLLPVSVYPLIGGNTVQQQVTQETLRGRILDEAGDPVIGATVMVKGTGRGTTSDVEGRFSLNVSRGEVLVISFIGMETKEIKLDKPIATIEVVLGNKSRELENVIVTGYRTISKERAAGAYSIINEKSMKGKMETDVISRLEGIVPGMNRVSSNSNEVVIRGITSHMGNRTPLYIVDGMPYDGELSAIAPSDVQNVTVLKDAAASSIYGVRAANGVVVITTKRGAEGKTRVSYNASVKFTPKPDLDYLNLMNSSELVDMQIAGFNHFHTQLSALTGYAVNPVMALLYQHEAGTLTDDVLKAALLPYRQTDNRKEIEKAFARTGITHQHNLSVSGGSEKHSYAATLNYLREEPNQRKRYNDRIGFTMKNDVKFVRWLSGTLSAMGSFSRSDYANGNGSYLSLIQGYPSYYALHASDGTANAWLRNKSIDELARLQSIGLMDESYKPLENWTQSNLHTNNNYFRLLAALNFKVIDGLTLDVKYLTELTNYKSQQLYGRNSWRVRNAVNDAAVYNSTTGELTLNVPKGGQLDETRSDTYAYTFRVQANYDKTFNDKHELSALIGAERQLARTTSTRVYYMGYDENSLAYTPYDAIALTLLRGTEALSGSYSFNSTEYNYKEELEDRFVSFYANASYTYDNRYTLTGSIRIDQSNLFGTDPKYQYKPLWSLGGSWQMKQERFLSSVDWLDRLTLRATYGIGGNVSKKAGPYLTIQNVGFQTFTKGIGSRILNPPNPELRWEKTATVNFGIDFSVLKNRLSGSIDLYNKHTTDLLGERNADPTLGWNLLTLNYGTMYNRGVEIALQSVNIQQKDFSWATNLTFSYNKNKLTRLDATDEDVFRYVSTNVATTGYPLNSLFSYRYAGLSSTNGGVLVYDKDGNTTNHINEVSSLVYSGTTTPPYSASLKNFLTYKDFELSWTLMYYGGHVFRDVVAPYLRATLGTNVDRAALNYWKKPGDETISGIAPAMNYNLSTENAQYWYSADVHVKKADFIKLRDVSLSYHVPRQWLKRYGVESLTLSAQLSNVWWWAANGDIDPEAYTTQGYGFGVRTLPQPMTWTFGLSLNF